jgi:hypothetical protein
MRCLRPVAILNRATHWLGGTTQIEFHLGTLGGAGQTMHRTVRVAIDGGDL